VNVAVYVGVGTTTRARANPLAVLNRHGAGIRAVNFTAANVVRHLDIASYDVVLFPGGGGAGEADALGSAGLAAVRAFVAAGGGYVGICAGAFLAIQHLELSPCRDMPRPVPGRQRGDGNVTLSLTAAGAAQLTRFNVTAARLDGLLVFYANGPVMVLGNHIGSPAAAASSTATPSPFYEAEVLLTYSSKSVPIEGGYVGHDAGCGAAAVCSNRYRPADSDGGLVLVSGPHPETDQMDFPARNGPPSKPGSERAALLVAYVKHVTGHTFHRV